MEPEHRSERESEQKHPHRTGPLTVFLRGDFTYLSRVWKPVCALPKWGL
jgi:hypothetical protein